VPMPLATTAIALVIAVELRGTNETL
jgi:hypothetical protein